MRFPRYLLFSAFLFAALAVLSAAHAQIPAAENEKRLTSSLALLAHGNEDEQGAALFQLAQLSLPPEQGIPLFQAHLKRHTGTLAEALIIAHALQGLASYGPRAHIVLPDLIRLLDEIGTVEGEAVYGGQMWGWLLTDLSKIGPDDPNTVEALKRSMRRCLDSPERLDTLGSETARALGSMGRPSHTAAPLLTLALGRIPIADSSVATALSHMMPEAKIAVPALIRTLEARQSPDAIVEALGTMGPAAKSALPALHRTLTLSPPLRSCLAFAAIARIEGPPKLTVPESLAILRQLDRHSIAAIHTAFATVKLQGTKAEDAAPILVQIVARRTEPWYRRTAIETLADVGPADNRDAGLTLIQAANGKDPVIALDADKAFENFGTMAEKVVPELTTLLKENGQARRSVLALLNPLGRKAAPAVPVLAQLMREEMDAKAGNHDSYSIPWLLGRIGPDAQEAVPTLTDLILSPKRGAGAWRTYARTTLLATLMRIGITPRVLPAVREMLQSDQPTDVACAAHAVALLGPQAKDTVPLLLRPLRPDYKDSDMTSGFYYGYVYETSARNESILALAKLGAAAKEALPLLQRFADMPDADPVSLRFGPPDLKKEAQQAIQAIRPAKGT